MTTRTPKRDPFIAAVVDNVRASAREIDTLRQEVKRLRRIIDGTRQNLSDFAFNGMCPAAVEWEIDRIDEALRAPEGA